MNNNNTATDTAPNPSSEAPSCMEMPMENPTPEHRWLERFVGTWDIEIEVSPGPGQPTQVMHGTEIAQMVGPFWLVTEGSNEVFPYRCRLTLGYDATRGRYVGSWIDTMTSHFWRYDGQVDATGRILSLDTEGPFPGESGLVKFREVTEFITDDHRRFTSNRQNAQGGWDALCRMTFRRRA
ncbi:MAG: DUF1579 domain-containing protein [Opitutus sp.]|nr:DUF1579 domain-containing protein [Opitutus sp.]